MDKKVKIFHLQYEATDFIFWLSDIAMLQSAEEWRQQYIDYKNYVQATIEKVCIIVNQKYK